MVNRRDLKVGNRAVSKAASREAKAARALPGQLIRRVAEPRVQPRNRDPGSLEGKVARVATPRRAVRRRPAWKAVPATAEGQRAQRGTQARVGLAARPAVLPAGPPRVPAALAAAR